MGGGGGRRSLALLKNENETEKLLKNLLVRSCKDSAEFVCLFVFVLFLFFVVVVFNAQ